MSTTRRGNASSIHKLSTAAASAALVMFGVMQAKADIIYSNAFPGSSGVLLNGTAPGTFNNSGGEIGFTPVWTAGTTSSDFKADGSAANTSTVYSNAFLPFNPNSGEVYQLDATLFTSTNSGGWNAFGFQSGSTVVTTANAANRIIDPAGGGYAFLLHRGNDGSGANNDQLFQGPGTTVSAVNMPLGFAQQIPEDAEIYLDTTGAQWVANLYVRSTASGGNSFFKAASFTYSPGALPIHNIAVNQGNATSGKISNLQLQNVSLWNTDGDANWTDSTNWHGSVPNGVNAEADFLSAITSSHTVTIGSAVTEGTIRFNTANTGTLGDATANSRSYTLSGSGSLTIQGSLSSGGIIDVESGAEQISVPVTLASNATVNAATGTSVSFSNAISGTGKLTLTGGGVVNLQPTNNYQGGTAINGDTVTNFSAIGMFGSGSTLSFGGGTLQYAAGNTTDITSVRNVSFTGGTNTIDVGGNSITFGTGISGAGGLNKAGSGTLNLNAANSFTGNTSVSGGLLVLNNPLALQSSLLNYNSLGGAISFGTLTSATLGGLSGNQALALDNVNSQAVALTVGGPLNLSNATFSGALTGDGGLTYNGKSFLFLTGLNTYLGGTTINGGAVQFGAGSLPASPATAGITINSGGALNIAGAFSTVTSALPAITTTSSGAVALTASSSENIDFTGYNNLLLGASSNATYTGTITPANGAYRLGGGGATITIPNTNELTGSNSLVVGAANSVGTVALTGTNNYAGGTTISGGALSFASLLNVGSGSTLTLNGGGTLVFATGNTTDISTLNVTLGAGGGIINTNGNNVTLNNPIGNNGPGSLTKAGSGILTLKGNDTYTGGTSIIGGTLNFSAADNLGTGATLTLNGGALQYATGVTPDLTGLSVVLGSSGGIIDTNGNNESIANITGSGALTKSGNGILTLSGVNNYTGGTTINAGNLQINAGAAPTSGLITIGGSGVLDVGAGFPTVMSLISSGRISNASTGVIGLNGDSAETINMGTLSSVFVGAANNATYTGVLIPSLNQYRLGDGGATLTLPNSNELSGVGNGLTIGTGVAGIGTVVLSGNNSYGGTTTIVTGGTVRFSSLNSLGTGKGAGQQLNISGGTLQYATGNTDDITSRNFLIFSGGATIDTNGNNVTFNHSFGSNGGAFTKAGLGNLQIGSTVMVGNTQVSGGTLTLADPMALQNSTLNYNSLGGSISFGNLSAATFGGIAGNQNLDLDNASSTAVALTIGNNNGATSYSGNLTGGGSVTKIGTGVTTLSGHSTYAGATSILSGGMSLNFGTTGTTNILPANALTLGGGQIGIAASGATASSQAFSSTTLSQRSSSIADTLTSGGATLSLGAITRNTGTGLNLLTVPTVGAVTTTTANANFSGGVQTILGGYFLASSNTWAVSASDGTNPGAITGLGSTSYDTAGFDAGKDVDVQTTAAPSSGPLTINSMRFSAAGAHTVGSIGDGVQLNIATGGILNASTSGAISLDDDTITSGNGQDLIFWNQSASNMAVASNITDNGATPIGVTLNSGNVILQIDSSYTGATTINGGTLQFFDQGCLGNGEAINLRGGVLEYNGNSDDLSSRTFDIGYGGGTINTNGNTVSFASGIGNNDVGSLTKGGTGKLTLNGNNTWQGSTAIVGGTLELGSGSVVSKIVNVSTGTGAFVVDSGASLTNPIDLSNSGTVIYNGSSWTLNTLSGGGTLSLPNGAAVTVANGPSTVTLIAASSYSGPISGNGASITVTNGALSLSGSNSYTGTTTATTGGELTVGALALNGGGPIDINGGILQFAGGNTSDLSTHTITVDINGAVIDTNGNNIAFANPIGNNGTGSLTKIGQGTLTFNAQNTYQGDTTASAGKLVFGTNYTTTAAVNVQVGAIAALGPGNSTSRTLTAGNLNVAAGGTFDIGSGNVHVNYTGGSPLGTLVGNIKAGYDGGKWDQPGINSSVAATSIHTGIGYSDSGSAVTLRYTYYGDATMNGTVDSNDFAALAANYGATGKGWAAGDFNYDGTVNALDFNQLATNYGAVLPISADLPDDSMVAQGMASSLGSVVPEPGSALLLIAGAAFGIRRRRKS